MMGMIRTITVLMAAVLIFAASGCKQNGSDNKGKGQKITISEPGYNSLDEYKKPEEKQQETVSVPETTQDTGTKDNGDTQSVTYCANISTKKFHLSSCNSVKQMKPDNMYKTNDRAELINAGYTPCANCDP